MYLGIDPSLCRTGIIILDRKGDILFQGCIVTESKPWKGRKWDRFLYIMNTLELICAKFHIEAVAIEDFAFSFKKFNSMVLYEICSWFRESILRHSKLPLMEVNINHIKKYATGNAKAKKEQIMMHVLKKWGHAFEYSDLADAFVLAEILRCYCEKEIPPFLYQQQILTALPDLKKLEEI